MLALTELLARHASPLGPEAALRGEVLAAQLAVLPTWRADGDALTRTYAFRDFHETMAFVNAIAWMAHREDHHPELRVSFAHCEVRYGTHSAGGITLNDFICAAKADALHEGR